MEWKTDPIHQIVIICTTCQQINKQELGMPNFEPLQTEYESLTEAWQHIYEAPIKHNLEMEIRKKND